MEQNIYYPPAKIYLGTRWYPLLIIPIFYLLACSPMKTNKNTETVDLYFTSPEAAIPVITDLLEKEQFEILAGYYDLSNSTIKKSELESGDFFIRTKRPESAHPAGFWRYKHPFAPGFKYSATWPTEKEGVYRIEVSISIEQGEDAPLQTGRSGFYMLKTDKGWKLLPDKLSEYPPPGDVPVIVQ